MFFFSFPFVIFFSLNSVSRPFFFVKQPIEISGQITRTQHLKNIFFKKKKTKKRQKNFFQTASNSIVFYFSSSNSVLSVSRDVKAVEKILETNEKVCDDNSFISRLLLQRKIHFEKNYG